MEGCSSAPPQRENSLKNQECEPSQCSRWWSSDPPQTASVLKEAWGILANGLPSIRQSIPHLNQGGKVRSSSSAALSCSSPGNLQARWHAGTFQHIPSPGVFPQLGVLARSNERPPRPAPFYMKTQQLSQELPLDVWAPHLITKTAELGKPTEQTHYGLMFPQTSPPVPEFTKSGISLSRIPVLLIILYVHRIKIFI